VSLRLDKNGDASDDGVMTLRVSGVPLSLDPLFGEAKTRMRKRRALIGMTAVLLAGAAVSLVFALRLFGGFTPGVPAKGGFVRTGSLTFSVPRGFYQTDIRGGLYMSGTRPPVIGHAVTNYPVSSGSPIHGGALPESEPANGVALVVQRWYAIGPAPTTRLHLPLSLHEPWAEQRLPGGTRRWAWLAHGKPGTIPYELVMWIGRNASPSDRTALLRTRVNPRGSVATPRLRRRSDQGLVGCASPPLA
jgi:hypothetical protein